MSGAEAIAASAGWYVYVLLSSDARRTYVGITTDPERRTRQHNGELPGGARSTRAGRPFAIARLLGPYAGRGEATRVERALKRVKGALRLTCDLPDPSADEA